MNYFFSNKDEEPGTLKKVFKLNVRFIKKGFLEDNFYFY